MLFSKKPFYKFKLWLGGEEASKKEESEREKVGGQKEKERERRRKEKLGEEGKEMLRYLKRSQMYY